MELLEKEFVPRWMRIASLADFKELGKNNLERLVDYNMGEINRNKKEIEDKNFFLGITEDEWRKISFQAYRLRIATLEEKVKKRKEWVRGIESIAKTTEEKPYVPGLRPDDFFNKGDKIIFYIGRKRGSKLGKLFVTGKILANDYGLITYVKDEVLPKRKKFTCATLPVILPEKEFGYLVQNPGFLNFWLKQIREYDGFKQAMRSVAPLKVRDKVHFFGECKGKTYSIDSKNRNDTLISRFAVMDQTLPSELKSIGPKKRLNIIKKLESLVRENKKRGLVGKRLLRYTKRCGVFVD